MTIPLRPEGAHRAANLEDVEALYNNAVQSFVRRDHVKTQATLSRLLESLKSLRRPLRAWYDLEASPEEEWTIKSLKLYISSHTSLYSDPPKNTSSLTPHIQSLLPPNPPSVILHHLAQTASQIYGTVTSPDTLLPPQLISTLLLASLNLRPLSSTLPFAHELAETWLSTLPEDLLTSLHSTQYWSPGDKKRIEGMREGYLKVVELFVGEVLVREKEWEMARGVLESEGLIPLKRKEILYRHIREKENRTASVSSPTNSAILPSTSPSSSGVFPAAIPKSRDRSRASSTSSSSSEKTARPGTQAMGLARIIGNGDGSASGSSKGKSREVAQSVASESTLASKIFVNPPPATPARRQNRSTSASTVLNSAIHLLPTSIRQQILALSSAKWTSLLVPLPVIAVVLGVLAIRRRLRRGTRPENGAIIAGAGVLTAEAIDSVRDRLRRARERGPMQWLGHWVVWWLQKIVGVWRMGTTITYV